MKHLTFGAKKMIRWLHNVFFSKIGMLIHFSFCPSNYFYLQLILFKKVIGYLLKKAHYCIFEIANLIRRHKSSSKLQLLFSSTKLIIMKEPANVQLLPKEEKN